MTALPMTENVNKPPEGTVCCLAHGRGGNIACVATATMAPLKEIHNQKRENIFFSSSCKERKKRVSSRELVCNLGAAVGRLYGEEEEKSNDKRKSSGDGEESQTFFVFVPVFRRVNSLLPVSTGG